MFTIVALGKSEFVLGFALAGVKTITSEKPQEDFERLLSDSTVGIIITDDATLNELPENFREKVEGLVKPVVVTLSTTATAQETLRKKIIKSIGVDLWNEN